MKTNLPVCLSSLLCIAVALTCLARPGERAILAGEWPQILGPNRNGIAEDEHLASAWPKGGPAEIWQREVGAGYAGVAVAEDRVVLFHRVGDDEIVEALDPQTGEQLWKKAYPTTYVSSIAPDDGPRCVPLVHAGNVYLCGAQGRLRSLALASGKEHWSRDVYREFRAPEGYFGAGSSPIIEGDRLLLNVGGADGAGLVAFSLPDGATVWKSTDEAASYSSPTAATLDGARHVIFVTRYNVVSVDPAQGKVRFQFPFGMRGPTVNAATPLVFDGHLFVSASYGVGAVMSTIGTSGAKKLWDGDDVMSSQYTTCVHHDGYLYGIHGRQDVGIAELRCCNPYTGKVMWTERDFGSANLILADGKLLIMKTDGTLVLAEPSPKAFRQQGSHQVFTSTVQALCALSDGRLYARDTRTLKCLDVKAK